MHSTPSLRSSTRSNRRTRSLGFTLIEIMVVMLIIGLMAAMVTKSVIDRAGEAKVLAARSDINNIMQALKLYKLDNNRYPSGEQGLEALIRKPTTGTIPGNWKSYLEKLPTDPWGTPYQYANPGIKGDIDVYSLGADQKAGGEGNDADIGSWQ
ncbi:type II secretion system major pseudopilin GspG [Roseateles microcysteis]|uniref:type II secretion system major pseudopilin GspG n=1 Tax=Roseateles microcysteis TaxID=3119057 RepID=UPI002FE65638